MTDACEGPVCVTCSDQADEVVVVASGAITAEVEDAGGRRSRVDVSLVDPVRAGDTILVHAGVAIAALGAAATVEVGP